MILRHDRSDLDCLVNESDWPGVLSFFDGDGAGTLISPTWILTAAHTARNIPPDHTVTIAGNHYQVARVIIHPGNQLAPVQPVDIALVELAKPVTNIVPFSLYEHADEQGQEITLLGRGDYGNGLDGVQGTDHKLRRVTNLIDEVDDTWIKFRFNPPPDCTQLEGVAGEGDSGGPAFLLHKGQFFIAGVSSWQDHGDRPLGTYHCIEHYVRVARYAPWIRLTAGV